MKGFASVLALAISILLAAGVPNAITVGSCSDNTIYGKCSTANPGNYCIGSITNPSLQLYVTKCPCNLVPGWVQQGTGDTATCALAKCGSIDNGACDPSNKPKLCASGTLIDNASKCGCPYPEKQKVNTNGVTCIYKPCDDNGVNVTDGLCAPKTAGKKCIQNVLVDKASECPCKAGMTKIGETCVILCEDGTKLNECSAVKPKECALTGTGTGYLKDNAAKCGCPEGKSAVGTVCSDIVLPGLGGADLLGSGPSGNESGAQASASGNPLSCCCLPAALIGILGGFAFVRKKE